jgi:hypothetical protein
LYKGSLIIQPKTQIPMNAFRAAASDTKKGEPQQLACIMT